MKAIELVGLRKSYAKGVTALDGLELSVEQGSILGFVGPNGAGKSTTINIIAGLIRKDAGEVRLLGGKIEPTDFDYKRNIGFVLETPRYIEKLTAREYLRFAASMYGINDQEAEERIDELLGFLNLEGKKKDRIESYSAGMKKKVSLAAAIIHRPKILVLDEPLEAIDPVSAKIIKDNLRLMVQQGVTVLLSSHVLDTVEKLCDEIAIINKGKIVFQSKMEEIKAKLKDQLGQETYSSLEEIFVEVVTENSDANQNKKLSWL
ncbi:MAG: ABC transporter ATP-binding protein [Bacteroidetes bacterium]|nr:ABC transporter ATP-binding protein [Bacteroidota bacterium]MCL5737938.1 ABC transporter ATP-binding protein [Bacteroidota bacterium]